MMKPGSASCSNGAASQNTVFIDTSLDTHLAMVVLDGDTVSDFKEKIEKEHPLCFPHVGNIKIHALKVKRKGYFYHLSDSMYLKSVFVGVNKSWFLFIDASSANDHSIEPNNGNLLTYFGMVNNNSIDGMNLGRSSQLRKIPDHDALSFQDDVDRPYLNEKAPSDIHFDFCQFSKKDLIIKKAEVTHSVENCNKVQLGTRVHGGEDRIEPLEYLPTVSVNHKSKKRKAKLMNEHALEVDNSTIDDNGQNPLQEEVGSRENLRVCASKEDSDLPMVKNQSNADEPCRNLSCDTRNESEYGLKVKFNLSEEIEVPGKLDGKNDKSKIAFHPMHNSSLEVAEQAGPTAKEMHKTGEINGVKLKDGPEGNRDLVSDSNKVTSQLEVASDYLSENKQSAKVVIERLSTEPGVHLLDTGSSYAKRKKKKRKDKLSDNPKAVDLILSGAGTLEDARPESDITPVPSLNVEDASISKLVGLSAKEKNKDSNLETAENFASPPDVNMNNSDLDDVKHMRDASDKAVYGVNRSTDSEERVSMQIADTKVAMVEKCHSSSGAGADINTTVTQISELLHLNGTAKITKGSEKKKTKKSKGLAEGRPNNLVTTGARDSAHGTVSTELHGVDGDNSSSKAKLGESNISLVKGESNISLVKGESTVDASVLSSDRDLEIDETNRSEGEPLLQINKTQAGAENLDEQVGKKLKKKLKKRPVTSMKSVSEIQTKGNGNEDSTPSMRSNGEVKSVSKSAKKIKLSKVKPRNEVEVTNLDSTRFSKVESSPSSIQTMSRIVGSSILPSHASEGNPEGRPLEASMDSNTSKDGTTDNVDKHVEVSCESNKVDIQEQAGQLHHESVEMLIDKFSREKSANTLLKTKRKKKDLSACSSEASLSLQNPRKSDENAETGSHSQTSNSISLKLQGLSSKAKHNEMLEFDNKVKKISRDGVKSPPSNKHEQHMSDSDKDRVRANAVETPGNSAEKNSEAFAVPRKRSNLKNSKGLVHQDKRLVERNPTRNGNRNVTQSEQKNLLDTSGGIFKDASSDSNEDEDVIADSHASTRSPSDSLSSDFSDGESNSSMKRSKNGSIELERKSIRGRSIRKTGSSSPENMTLDTILRSSSRYKKAKLTAAQSQLDDTESQPIDFVPDSQANL